MRVRDGFLQLVRDQFGTDRYFGTAPGATREGDDGSGLPVDTDRNFMFATGIECSYPTIGHGTVRRDLLEESGHYTRWREDLALVAELGLRYVRYGFPYYRVHLAPGRYDWSFCDEAMVARRYP